MRGGVDLEVYVDLYFLINASMDLLCLLITGRLLHSRAGMLRLLLGAGLGGAYAVLSLLLGFGGAMGFFADLLTAFVLAFAVFYTSGMRFLRLLRYALTYVLVSMILGGVMTALYTLLNRLALPFEVLEGDTLSVWVLGALALVAGIATVRGGRMMGLSARTRAVEVEAVLLGKRIALHAMVDTGNLLRDPVSGRSVIVADRRCGRGVLPRAIMEQGKAGEAALFAWLRDTPEHASAVRLIPAKTATGEGLLVAVVPDRLVLTERGERFAGDYLVAFSDLGEAADGFDAVIPST